MTLHPLETAFQKLPTANPEVQPTATRQISFGGKPKFTPKRFPGGSQPMQKKNASEQQQAFPQSAVYVADNGDTATRITFSLEEIEGLVYCTPQFW